MIYYTENLNEHVIISFFFFVFVYLIDISTGKCAKMYLNIHVYCITANFHAILNFANFRMVKIAKIKTAKMKNHNKLLFLLTRFIKSW